MTFSSRRGPVFAFDVDGVLADNSERLAMALRRVGASSVDRIPPRRRNRFWALFLSEDLVLLDKPRVEGIRILLDRLSRGSVIIVTGRPAGLRRTTLRQLREWGVPVDKVEVIMRPQGDRRGEVEYKLGVLLTIPGLAEVHDDNREVLEAIGRRRRGVALYWHRRGRVELLNSGNISSGGV